jgi:uncharacterized membrane protein YgcG
MAAVILYFFQLKEEFFIQVNQVRAIKAKLSKDASEEEKTALKAKLKTLKNDRNTWIANAVVNTTYFPMTVVLAHLN